MIKKTIKQHKRDALKKVINNNFEWSEDEMCHEYELKFGDYLLGVNTDITCTPEDCVIYCIYAHNGKKLKSGKEYNEQSVNVGNKKFAGVYKLNDGRDYFEYDFDKIDKQVKKCKDILIDLLLNELVF